MITQQRSNLFWFGLNLTFLAISIGPLFIGYENYSLGVPRSVMAICGAAIILLSTPAVLRDFNSRGFVAFEPGWGGLCASLLLVLFSDFPYRPHNPIQIGPQLYYFIAAFLSALLLMRFPLTWMLLFLGSIGFALLSFHQASAGQLIFSDDHPSFLYRLIQLKHHFPAIPFYNLQWNAGVEAREFFPSGTLNVFFLWYPLIALFDPTLNYNFIVAGTLFVITPCSAFLAARLMKLSYSAASIAGVLSLGHSYMWYRWALSYGTMGFITSVALFPLAIALIVKLIQNPSYRGALLSTLCLTLIFLWSPAAVAAIPLLIWILAQYRLFKWSRAGLLFVVLMITLNLPWVTVFISTSPVMDFVQSGGHAQLDAADTDRTQLTTLRKLKHYTNAAHPLLLIFSVAGLTLLRNRKVVMLYAAMYLWLLSLSTLVPIFKPQLEFDRMCLLLGGTALVPVASCLDRLRTFSTSLSNRICAALACGLLFIIPLTARMITVGKSTEHVYFATPIVQSLARAIAEHGGEGRVLFAGFILHELNGGHVAPLPHFSNKSLLASRYQHDRWNYVDIIPEEFRNRGEEGVIEFLEIHNVSAVVTHDRFWKKWYRERPQNFKEVWNEGRFTVFKRLDFLNSYFERGSGEILEISEKSVTFSLTEPQALLRFNYFPFLQVPGCKVLPEKIGAEVTFVHVEGCPLDQPLVLSAQNIFQRLLSKYKP